MNDHQNLLGKMRDITKELMAHGPQAATAAIQKALHEAGAGLPSADQTMPLPDPQKAGQSAMRDINPRPLGKKPSPESAMPATADASLKATDVDSTYASPGAQSSGIGSRFGELLGELKKGSVGEAGLGHFVPDLLAKLGVGAPVAHGSETVTEGGQFVAGSFTHRAGTRQYKLYIPSCYDGQSLPMVVMLHGCTQDPDDFARGTQMNAAAERYRCLVLYPQQSQSANSSKCWNWFNPKDQQRGSGEPAIIAGMTGEVAERYKIDPQQIYVAGLSAGGAMAAIMGTVYPDLYAGVGVHSGLPYGSATDLPSALAAMRSGVAGTAALPKSGSDGPAFKGIPIIVFHGDADHTVNARNGIQVLASSAPATPGKSSQVRSDGRVVGGHAYTRTVQHDASGHAVAEHWLIHGFGHAWAGGSPGGSYTDAKGPDATGEMMRFFTTQKNPAG